MDNGLILYAKCEVWYKGRAESYLKPGNYLIIRKKDGTLLIHGASLTTPLNYQPPGAELEVDGKMLISTRKSETIKIKVHKIHEKLVTDDWTDDKIVLWGTEAHLRDYVLQNIEQYFPNYYSTHVEYSTPVGAIDLLVVLKDTSCAVVELKRKKANLAACSQLGRYVQHLRDLDYEAVGYILGPDITANALKHLEANGHHFIQVKLPPLPK